MSDIKAAWDDVAASITDLGHVLKTHFADVPGGTPKGLDDAVARVKTTAERAYKSAGEAVKDPSVRENATKIGSSVKDAISTTLTEAGERLKPKSK